jgi:hypothetical protein
MKRQNNNHENTKIGKHEKGREGDEIKNGVMQQRCQVQGARCAANSKTAERGGSDPVQDMGGFGQEGVDRVP